MWKSYFPHFFWGWKKVKIHSKIKQSSLTHKNQKVYVLEFLKNLYIVHLVHLDLSVTMSKHSAGKRFMLRTRLKATKSQRVFSVSFHLQKWLKKIIYCKDTFFCHFVKERRKRKKGFEFFLPLILTQRGKRTFQIVSVLTPLKSNLIWNLHI